MKNYDPFEDDDPNLTTNLTITKRLDKLKFGKWHFFLVFSLGKFFIYCIIIHVCFFHTIIYIKLYGLWYD